MLQLGKSERRRADLRGWAPRLVTVRPIQRVIHHKPHIGKAWAGEGDGPKTSTPASTTNITNIINIIIACCTTQAVPFHPKFPRATAMNKLQSPGDAVDRCICLLRTLNLRQLLVAERFLAELLKDETADGACLRLSDEHLGAQHGGDPLLQTPAAKPQLQTLATKLPPIPKIPGHASLISHSSLPPPMLGKYKDRTWSARVFCFSGSPDDAAKVWLSCLLQSAPPGATCASTSSPRSARARHWRRWRRMPSGASARRSSRCVPAAPPRDAPSHSMATA